MRGASETICFNPLAEQMRKPRLGLLCGQSHQLRSSNSKPSVPTPSSDSPCSLALPWAPGAQHPPDLDSDLSGEHQAGSSTNTLRSRLGSQQLPAMFSDLTLSLWRMGRGPCPSAGLEGFWKEAQTSVSHSSP